MQTDTGSLFCTRRCPRRIVQNPSGMMRRFVDGRVVRTPLKGRNGIMSRQEAVETLCHATIMLFKR